MVRYTPKGPCTLARARAAGHSAGGAAPQRIEMALMSTQDQTVHLGGEAWFFRQRDAWITEHSVKYSPDVAAQAGWRIQRRWTNPHQQIALHLLLPAN